MAIVWAGFPLYMREIVVYDRHLKPIYSPVAILNTSRHITYDLHAYTVFYVSQQSNQMSRE